MKGGQHIETFKFQLNLIFLPEFLVETDEKYQVSLSTCKIILFEKASTKILHYDWLIMTFEKVCWVVTVRRVVLLNGIFLSL